MSFSIGWVPRSIGALVLALGIHAFVLVEPSDAKDEKVVHVCVDERTGQTRVVKGPRDCRRGEQPKVLESSSRQQRPEKPRKTRPEKAAPSDTSRGEPSTRGAEPRRADPGTRRAVETAEPGSLQLGENCSNDVSCSSGFCVDGTCCGTSCSGLCHACDLPGSRGSCVAIPDGGDPDEECGTVSCSAYYAGFVGGSCYRRAAVDTACSGAGSCQSAEEVCPMAPAGDVALTCHATCQVPVPGTCVGTNAGACSNVEGCSP